MHSLGSFRNKVLYKYYQLRINTLQDPYKIFLRDKPYKFLFILGHMRSGSSLLTHILNSNPEIIGYGETHTKYASELDFKKLMFKVYWRLKDSQMQHTYILDKVLHDHKILDNSLLLSDNLYVIFLIREPERSLSSIINIKPHWSEEKVFEYYSSRLVTLEKYAKLIENKNRLFFIDYDAFLAHTNVTFDALKYFLGTHEGFSEQYSVLKTTGVKGIGDSSENIKAGRIIRDSSKLERSISSSLVDQARERFAQCRTTMSAVCTSIEDNDAVEL